MLLKNKSIQMLLVRGVYKNATNKPVYSESSKTGQCIQNLVKQVSVFRN